jgi:hypothetical protein
MNIPSIQHLAETAKALALAVDSAHVAAARAWLAGSLCNTPDFVHSALDALEAGTAEYTIIIVPLAAEAPCGIWMADGPLSFRRQMARAIKACHGARTMWVRLLDDGDRATSSAIIDAVCAQTWGMTP